MSWDLKIHMIDVGQGESSLIIARNDVLNLHRTMLIDGGNPIYAQTVHEYVVETLGKLHIGLDHILLSHYDGDHSGGILALLTADNLYGVCEVLGTAAGNAADAASARGVDYYHQIAAAAAATCAAMFGAYDLGPLNRNFVAVNAGKNAEELDFIPDISAKAADVGYDSGKTTVDDYLSTVDGLNAIIVRTGTSKRIKVCRAAGIAAADATGSLGPRIAAAIAGAFNELKTTVLPAQQFNTGGIYRNVHIIDIGKTNETPGNYADVLAGKFTMASNSSVQAPNINRLRTSLAEGDLGSEILWNSGNGPIIAPDNSPALFVMACLKYIWNAPADLVPIASGQTANGDSIGLILRFNNFLYYTGGDLPSQGEDLIADALENYGLPNPAGGQFPISQRIACFKCGHHGSDHSTSAHFLSTTLPRGALISCGKKQFKDENHPNQNTINRLHDDPNILYFYLTNCKYITNHIPASYGNNQLVPGNKSRVSGENNYEENLDIGRIRGNISLSINEAQSRAPNAPVPPGQVLGEYIIMYYEDYSYDPKVKNCIDRIELIVF